MNNNEGKTHYRKVFKSDHLGVADLEELQELGKALIFTIAFVNQEMGAKVAGKKIDANIAYFKEAIKPLVLNATNSKVMKDLTNSSFVDDWKNITVQLYIDKDAKLMGERVGGVRVSPKRVQAQKQQVVPENVKVWTNAKKSYLETKSFENVLKRAEISKENQSKMIAECENV